MCPTNAPSKFTVAILPLGSVSSWQIKFTMLVLKRVFDVETTVLPEIKTPSRYFNAERGRYQASMLLRYLFTKLPANTQRIVGIIEGDLETETTEPCLGLATLHNRVALYSAPRISEEEFSQVKNEADQDYVSYHLIVHEFGHTLGLPHCSEPKCAMRNQSYNFFLCAHCRRWADRELQVKPGSAEERFSHAEALCRYNRLHEAIATYREVVSCAPHEPLYHYCLAMALGMSKEKNEASQELKTALELSKDASGLTYSFGLLWLRSNRLERAEKEFTRAISMAKDKKFIQRLIGQAYREITHDVGRASWHYTEYLQLGGDDQDVIDWLISRNRLVG